MGEHVPFTHSPPNPSNWRRIFCWRWGHEYYVARGLLLADDVLVCLRCFCSNSLEAPCCAKGGDQ